MLAASQMETTEHGVPALKRALLVRNGMVLKSEVYGCDL